MPSWARWPWRRSWAITATVASVHEVPDTIRRARAVLVATNSHRKWLVFDCPCKERHRVMINLDPAHRPAWVVPALAPLTVTPSVDETRGRARCHYLITGGRIHWV